MNTPIIDEKLWNRIEPLLPRPKARRAKYAGRNPVPDRAVLSGIVFVLRNRLRWRDLPIEMGYGSGVTCWRRLRDWQEAGIWEPLRELLLAELHTPSQINSSRVIFDPSSVRAIKACQKRDRTS